MTIFEFLLKTNRTFTDEEVDRLYKANTLDNCTIGSGPEGGEIDVTWEAETFEAAVEEATAAFKAVVPDFEVKEVVRSS